MFAIRPCLKMVSINLNQVNDEETMNSSINGTKMKIHKRAPSPNRFDALKIPQKNKFLLHLIRQKGTTPPPLLTFPTK